MRNDLLTAAIRERLFSDPEAAVFAVLDGASVPGLLDRLRDDRPNHACLYLGELHPSLAAAAPYLVELDPDTEFTQWVIGDGWSRHWGIFALTGCDLRALQRHFRTLTIVRGPDGKPLYFRFYDPRVLGIYLPLCNEAEMETVFGPVRAFAMEDEDPGVFLRFTPAEDSPQAERITLLQQDTGTR